MKTIRLLYPDYVSGGLEMYYFGANCIVSLAPFDYLHGLYENTGIIWIDAHI